MYEQEENQLNKMNEQLHQVPIPHEKLDDAIQTGALIAKAQQETRRKNKKRMLLSLAFVAIISLAFVVSVRLSPAFANTMSSVPGLNKIVELIQWDQGIKKIVEMEYYEAIGVSKEKNQITITIDYVSIDEHEILISYNIQAPFNLWDSWLDSVIVKNDGVKIKPSSLSYQYQESETYKTDLIRYTFLEKQQFNSQNFEVEFHLNDEKETVISIPFTAKQAILPAKQYDLHQQINIENQSVTIESVTIYPTKTEVIIDIDPANTMRILQFVDLRVEDDQGNSWGSIRNGVVTSEDEKGRLHYFLQSNYFEHPQQLFLKLNRVQALPKGQDYLEVDLQKQQVLKEPTGNPILIISMTNDSIETEVSKSEEFEDNWVPGIAINARDENVRIPLETIKERETTIYRYIEFEPSDVMNPIKIPFAAYPNYIESDISIELK